NPALDAPASNVLVILHNIAPLTWPTIDQNSVFGENSTFQARIFKGWDLWAEFSAVDRKSKSPSNGAKNAPLGWGTRHKEYSTKASLQGLHKSFSSWSRGHEYFRGVEDYAASALPSCTVRS